MSQGRIAMTWLASALLAWMPAAGAEVLRSDDSGFTVRQLRTVGAPQSRAWQVLLKPSLWWHPDHTFSGDAANLHMSVPPGGCFCEKLADMGGVQHMQVIHAAPPELLRLSGGLGPLQSHPVTGLMEWRLSDEGQGTTRLSLEYQVRGVAGGDWAGPVDSVLGTQMDRLVRFLEKGDSAPAGG